MILLLLLALLLNVPGGVQLGMSRAEAEARLGPSSVDEQWVWMGSDLELVFDEDDRLIVVINGGKTELEDARVGHWQEALQRALASQNHAVQARLDRELRRQAFAEAETLGPRFVGETAIRMADYYLEDSRQLYQQAIAALGAHPRGRYAFRRLQELDGKHVGVPARRSAYSEDKACLPDSRGLGAAPR